jgi:hypothetical protein
MLLYEAHTLSLNSRCRGVEREDRIGHNRQRFKYERIDLILASSNGPIHLIIIKSLPAQLERRVRDEAPTQ